MSQGGNMGAAVKVAKLDQKQRLSAESYVYLSDHTLEVEVLVRSKHVSGKRIGEPTRVTLKFDTGQVRSILKAGGAKSVDEIREQVANFIKDNVAAALTEATRTR